MLHLEGRWAPPIRVGPLAAFRPYNRRHLTMYERCSIPGPPDVMSAAEPAVSADLPPPPANPSAAAPPPPPAAQITTVAELAASWVKKKPAEVAAMMESVMSIKPLLWLKSSVRHAVLLLIQVVRQ